MVIADLNVVNQILAEEIAQLHAFSQVSAPLSWCN